jgi:CBS domain-containing protein
MLVLDSQLPIAPSVAYLGGSVRRSADDSPGGKVRLPPGAEARLALTDGAVHVVTDFVWEPPVTVPEERPIDDALLEMIRAGVRALLVVRDEVVTGLVTSYDITGERPLQFLAASGYGRHDEIQVGHIMTPWAHVPVLDWQAISAARVSDLAVFFRHSSATHVVLAEYADRGGTFVRGLVSRARLERQLGHPL